MRADEVFPLVEEFVTPSKVTRCTCQHERADTLRKPNRDDLRQGPAHGRADDVRLFDIEVVEHFDRIERHSFE